MTDDEWPMVLPFVCVESAGGPYDDASFAAGVSLGALRVVLQLKPQVYSTVVPTPLLEQVDLAAMEAGYVTQSRSWDEAPDEWVLVVFTRATGLVP